MARKRLISPEFFTSESLALLPLEVERTFAGLWTYCDDEGRGKDQPALVRAALWALREKHTTVKVDRYLDDLVRSRKVCRYTVEEVRLLHVVNFGEHQKPSHPTPSVLSPCPVHELHMQNAESLQSLSRISLETFLPNVVGFSSGESSSGDAGSAFGESFGSPKGRAS